MTLHSRSRAAAALLALTAACSLRSLDYLEAGGAEGSSGARSGASFGGDSGASSNSSSGGVGASGAGASASTESGSGSGTPSSGSGGTPSSGSGGMGSSGGAGAGATPGAAGAGETGAAGAPPEVPDCADELVTVDETDLDCGGRTCEPCADGKKCLAGTDCRSAICTNQVCQPPTCTDLAVNGDETDLNCGGTCPRCAQGMHCQVNGDCATQKCRSGTCVSAVCEDGVLEEACPLLVDNTPYSLAPSHALGKCIEDDGQSVAEGTAMVLASCKAELQQTFWAVAQPEGYFALRSALSGKCLQVRGASRADNAVIEQSACDLAPEQLWKPSIVNESLMQLTSKLSQLALDVAGNNVTTELQPIVQGKASASADTHWRVLKRTTAAYVTLSPLADSNLRVGHSSSLTTLTSVDDATVEWKVMPGLADVEAVSFQARDEPGRYLRHSSFHIWSDTNDGTQQFKADATFRYVAPFVGTAAMTRSLQSVNHPDRFVLRRGAILALTLRDGTAAYNEGATWRMSHR